MLKIKTGLKAVALLALFLLANFFLDATLYNPAFIIPVYKWFDDHHVTGFLAGTVPPFNERAQYPFVSIARINNSLFWGPRASVEGIVDTEVKVTDGDWHLNIVDPAGRVLVAEIVPEYPLPLPRPGEKVRIWGITRFDLEHRWWELHPVIGWQPAP